MGKREEARRKKVDLMIGPVTALPGFGDGNVKERVAHNNNTVGIAVSNFFGFFFSSFLNLGILSASEERERVGGDATWQSEAAHFRFQ